MTVNTPLVILGQAKPSLQIEIISDLFILAFADEKTGDKAFHYSEHMIVNKALRPLEPIADR